MSEPISSGELYIVAAPSGAGKTSLVRALLKDHPDVGVSVSHTTRQRRPDETDGMNYHFVTEAAFQDMISAGEFLEHALVFGHHYGTSLAEVERIRQAGQHVVLEIDWQGGQQVRASHQCKSIFILPPSMHVLRERLTSRAQDNADTIARRMAEAVNEISHYHEFDYLVINDNFDLALAQLTEVIEGRGDEFSMQQQQGRHQELISSLIKA